MITYKPGTPFSLDSSKNQIYYVLDWQDNYRTFGFREVFIKMAYTLTFADQDRSGIVLRIHPVNQEKPVLGFGIENNGNLYVGQYENAEPMIYLGTLFSLDRSIHVNEGLNATNIIIIVREGNFLCFNINNKTVYCFDISTYTSNFTFSWKLLDGIIVSVSDFQIITN